mgnify:CR=1 FL=1
MAFSGLHVVCAEIGSATQQHAPAPLTGRIHWSERLAAGEVTSLAAPGSGRNGDPVFQLRAAVDGYARLGTDPNAVGAPEMFVPAGEFVTFFIGAGTRLKWVPA